MNSLERLFARKLTENGDDAFNTTGDKLLDILFMTEYLGKHLDEVSIGDSDTEKLFAMFVRDPRYGLGRRDLGRELMIQAGVSFGDAVRAGRFDDIFAYAKIDEKAAYDFIIEYVCRGNELAKKWMPRFNTKNDALAKRICNVEGIPQ